MIAFRRSIPKSPARRAAGAFTLLEVMLAVILGAMVLTTALGIFASLQRSNRHNEDRLRNAMNLSMTHRSVELALRSMILSTSRPPAPADNLVAREGIVGNANQTPDDPAAEDETDFERPRVILSRDESLPPMRWTDTQGHVVQVEPQRLEITIERPPVFPEPRAGENFVPVVRRVYASRHSRNRDERREERRAEREDVGENETEGYDDTEPAIAAGVRGAFGLTWEVDQPRPGETPTPDGGSWSLWWRTLPPIVDIPDSDLTEGLTEDDLDNNPMYRPVRLASKLRWCKWEAVRAGETLNEFTSTWWEDLPAYVTLEIQTVSGKWSKWMFEVQGTRGAEPGTPTGGAAENPTNPVDGAVEAAIEQLGGAQNGGANGPSGGRNRTIERRGE
jgi:hypothetical protein